MKTLNTLLVSGALILGLGSPFASAADFPKLKDPILISSVGQSPDSNTIKVLAQKAKLKNVAFKPMATDADLGDVKTLLLSIGVSHKGFGVAGVNLDTEGARAKTLIGAAKAKHIPVVMIHIGGIEGREAMSQQMLDRVTPDGDAFVVYAPGNADGYFTKAAAGKPVITVAKPMELIKVFSEHAE